MWWNTEMCLNYNTVVLSLCSHFTWHTTRSNYLHDVQCSLRSSQPTDNIPMFHTKLKISYHLDPFLPSGLFQWSCETKTALVISTYYMWPTHIILLYFLNCKIFGKQNMSEVPHYVIPFTTSFYFTNPSTFHSQSFAITYPHSCYGYGQNGNVQKY